MLTRHVDFVAGGRAVLFDRVSRRRNLPAELGAATSTEEGTSRRTSVIAGHGMPERSKSRPEAGWEESTDQSRDTPNGSTLGRDINNNMLAEGWTHDAMFRGAAVIANTPLEVWQSPLGRDGRDEGWENRSGQVGGDALAVGSGRVQWPSAVAVEPKKSVKSKQRQK